MSCFRFLHETTTNTTQPTALNGNYTNSSTTDGLLFLQTSASDHHASFSTISTGPSSKPASSTQPPPTTSPETHTHPPDSQPSSTPNTAQTMGEATDYFTISRSTPLENPTTVSRTTPSPGATEKIDCPSIEGDMDGLTQEQFTSRLTHSCRYDKVVILKDAKDPTPLNVTVQIDLKHIEAVEQLVSWRLQFSIILDESDRKNNMLIKGFHPKGTIEVVELRKCLSKEKPLMVDSIYINLHCITFKTNSTEEITQFLFSAIQNPHDGPIQIQRQTPGLRENLTK